MQLFNALIELLSCHKQRYPHSVESHLNVLITMASTHWWPLSRLSDFTLCIESVSAQKHLGITIDKNLTWEQQIDLVCRDISRKLLKYVNQNSLKQYYNSYVLPVFDFGCVVWGNTTYAILTRLVKLQKRAARMILKADFMTPSEQLFKELNWVTPG